jgi:transcriptional regulator GlxA family with amidase domain
LTDPFGSDNYVKKREDCGIVLEESMKKVTILALNNAMSASVMGPMDILSQAGYTYNHLIGVEPSPFFEVKIASMDGGPVRCFNDAKIHPHCGIDDVRETDLLIIPSFLDFDALILNRKAADWVEEQHKKGATVGAICGGTFLLAQTGLLDGKTATTHWGFAKAFRKRYPQIILLPEQLITDEGTLLCSGGCNSYVDLSVYLIERFCGRNVALQCSKTMLHDFARSSQTPYIVFQHHRDHNDEQILAVQKRIEENFANSLNPEELAREYGMSRRTFERRFKKATGLTPGFYLQRTRVEAAKHMLETEFQTFDEISYKVGYEDTSYFKKVFVRHAGLTPAEYKMKFHRQCM